MSNLYKCIYDAKETQIGFSLKYFPRHALSENLQRMIKRTSVMYRTRQELLVYCDPAQTKLNLQGEDWSIVWQNNAIPTETEWKSMYEIRLELRETNLHGKVAILSKL